MIFKVFLKLFISTLINIRFASLLILKMLTETLLKITISVIGEVHCYKARRFFRHGGMSKVFFQEPEFKKNSVGGGKNIPVLTASLVMQFSNRKPKQDNLL
jgi:hypothetical protein